MFLYASSLFTKGLGYLSPSRDWILVFIRICFWAYNETPFQKVVYRHSPT